MGHVREGPSLPQGSVISSVNLTQCPLMGVDSFPILTPWLRGIVATASASGSYLCCPIST